MSIDKICDSDNLQANLQSDASFNNPDVVQGTILQVLTQLALDIATCMSDLREMLLRAQSYFPENEGPIIIWSLGDSGLPRYLANATDIVNLVLASLENRMNHPQNDELLTDDVFSSYYTLVLNLKAIFPRIENAGECIYQELSDEVTCSAGDETFLVQKIASLQAMSVKYLSLYKQARQIRQYVVWGIT
jgi:hypothetical protein